ncbi:hypothetical protein M011DRAFT_25310 [Sporormia fimetaria CBS 119925]|uniref:Secreted protein n=1 Tax=Sporormia fimetaria CBS 119925 TaxID=1340428 RepID=A0A6A6VFT1_9PLEO|nr:hypothetical protein M011DRAFT_25310 [Sporormia fimetaria CBS 119925]
MQHHELLLLLSSLCAYLPHRCGFPLSDNVHTEKEILATRVCKNRHIQAVTLGTCWPMCPKDIDLLISLHFPRRILDLQHYPVYQKGATTPL